MRLVAILLALAACSREPSHVTVGVAAVLRHAMPEAVAGYRAASGTTIDVTYGASDVLADRVDRGTHFDAVVLADAETVDALVARNRIVAASRRTIATNTIVLVGAPGSAVTFASLTALPEGRKLAIGDPATVPAGRYAERYLRTLGAWDVLQPRLILGGDVAGVLALAQQGKAHAAVVYRSDARSAAPLAVLDEPTDAPTTSVVAGIGANSRHAAAARGFVDFLAGREGQAILARHGFTPAAP